MVQKNTPSYWKKAAVILCLVIFIAAGAVISGYWPTASEPENEQTAAAVQPENTVPAPAPRIAPGQQPVIATPAVKPPPLPVTVSAQTFTPVPPTKNDLEVIRSFDPQLSDWQGQFKTGVQVKRVQLNQTLLNLLVDTTGSGQARLAGTGTPPQVQPAIAASCPIAADPILPMASTMSGWGCFQTRISLTTAWPRVMPPWNTIQCPGASAAAAAAAGLCRIPQPFHHSNHPG